jgi:hypothetical protein
MNFDGVVDGRDRSIDPLALGEDVFSVYVVFYVFQHR